MSNKNATYCCISLLFIGHSSWAMDGQRPGSLEIREDWFAAGDSPRPQSPYALVSADGKEVAVQDEGGFDEGFDSACNASVASAAPLSSLLPPEAIVVAEPYGTGVVREEQEKELTECESCLQTFYAKIATCIPAGSGTFLRESSKYVFPVVGVSAMAFLIYKSSHVPKSTSVPSQEILVPVVVPPEQPLLKPWRQRFQESLASVVPE